MNIDVLGNDGDSDGMLNASKVTVTVGPADGSVTVNANGTLTYTPDAGFDGDDSFGYTVEEDETIDEDVILGTDRGDRLKGTRDDDDIRGMGGNDLLLGRNGDDRLFGGDGNDTLMGQAGNDLLFGGDGNDVLNSNGGSDTAVFAGAFADSDVTLNAKGRGSVTGPDGLDNLRNVEFLEFDDGVYDVRAGSFDPFDAS